MKKTTTKQVKGEKNALKISKLNEAQRVLREAYGLVIHVKSDKAVKEGLKATKMQLRSMIQVLKDSAKKE